MANPEATTEECYECGANLLEGEAVYQSLFPEKPHFAREMENGETDYSGFNKDYRVCHADYKKQYETKYPGEPMPLGIRKQEANWAAKEAFDAAMEA